MNRKKADNTYQYKEYFNQVYGPDMYKNHANKTQIKQKFEKYYLPPENVYNIKRHVYLDQGGGNSNRMFGEVRYRPRERDIYLLR